MKLQKLKQIIMKKHNAMLLMCFIFGLSLSKTTHGLYMILILCFLFIFAAIIITFSEE